MLSPEELKKRYQEHWARSNQRERFVKLFLDVYLPKPFKAELTGLGAGSTDYIDRTYRGLAEAFDIAILYEDYPIAFVEVTGIEHSSMAKPGLGYCVGTWKILDKADKLGVLDRVWIAYVIEGESTILWAPLSKFTTSKARPGKLYSDERELMCMKRRDWHSFRNPKWTPGRGKTPFLNWLMIRARLGPIKILGAARG